MDTRITAKEVRMKEWAAVIQDRVSSGMSVKAYCEANSIRRNVYFYWLRKLREAAIESKKGEGIVEIAIPEPSYGSGEAEQATGDVLTVRVGNMAVGVRRETPMELLGKVLEVVMHAQ